MPISAYFGGHGSEVMAAMKRKYGEKKGESVFYATAKKRHMEASDNPSCETCIITAGGLEYIHLPNHTRYLIAGVNDGSD